MPRSRNNRTKGLLHRLSVTEARVQTASRVAQGFVPRAARTAVYTDSAARATQWGSHSGKLPRWRLRKDYKKAR